MYFSRYLSLYTKKQIVFTVPLTADPIDLLTTDGGMPIIAAQWLSPVSKSKALLIFALTASNSALCCAGSFRRKKTRSK